MNQDLFDIFAETYVEQYDKLKQQYPHWPIKKVMGAAKETTKEYLYLCAKEKLPRYTRFWPVGFTMPEES